MRRSTDRKHLKQREISLNEKQEEIARRNAGGGPTKEPGSQLELVERRKGSGEGTPTET